MEDTGPRGQQGCDRSCHDVNSAPGHTSDFFAAYSGPFCTSQPHLYRPLLYSRGDTGAAAGPAKRKAESVEWGPAAQASELRLVTAQRSAVNERGRQSPRGGGLASGGNGWDLGVPFRRDTHVSSSSLLWEEFRNLPGSLE